MPAVMVMVFPFLLYYDVAGEFVDGQTIGHLTGEFVDGQTICLANSLGSVATAIIFEYYLAGRWVVDR
jgi:hypothetical protein